MKISYGPRGHSGVDSIMGLGDAVEIATPGVVALDQTNTRLVNLDRFTWNGAKVAGAMWLLASIFGVKSVSRYAGGGALALLVVRWLAKHPSRV